MLIAHDQHLTLGHCSQYYCDTWLEGLLPAEGERPLSNTGGASRPQFRSSQTASPTLTACATSSSGTASPTARPSVTCRWRGAQVPRAAWSRHLPRPESQLPSPWRGHSSRNCEPGPSGGTGPSAPSSRKRSADSSIGRPPDETRRAGVSLRSPPRAPAACRLRRAGARAQQGEELERDCPPDNGGC